MAMGQDFNRHIKRPLPPTLSGFPSEAEIRYYLKVTAQRAAFYKENFRTEIDFNFLPVEPTRIPANRRESYARRQHQFAPAPDNAQRISSFRKPSEAPTAPPPTINIDGRLPDPAIVTCNDTLPLRVLVKKLNETTEIVYLKTFQIVLIGYTKIRAHDLERTEKSSWVICSVANLQTPLGNSNTPANKDIELDSKMWSGRPLPNTICPTFETCNLSRHYELEISLGLVYGTAGNVKPELTVQPLRMPLQVYSGIKSREDIGRNQSAAQGMSDLEPSTPFPAPSPVPLASPGPRPPTAPFPHRTDPATDGIADLPDEPPPSYEDAIAEDLAPADGPRSDYEQHASPADSKRNLSP
ncbi:hypothetical protein MMC10_008677 [Thelotrema lepadinum]|nr:hypothetical protein [Thelotrema lepadinum]